MRFYRESDKEELKECSTNGSVKFTYDGEDFIIKEIEISKEIHWIISLGKNCIDVPQLKYGTLTDLLISFSDIADELRKIKFSTPN